MAPEEKEPPKVVDLMEALRRSLDAVSTDKKKTVKAGAAEAGSEVENRAVSRGCRCEEAKGWLIYDG